jgi:RNA polymerase sigma-70 factor, ECF subfamily
MTDSAPPPGAGRDRSGPQPTSETAQGRQAQATHLAHLIERCSRGHEDAFAELYDLTSARIYGLIHRVLRSPEQSAEVTQEVYVEIWRSRLATHLPRAACWRGCRPWRTAVQSIECVR